MQQHTIRNDGAKPLSSHFENSTLRYAVLLLLTLLFAMPTGIRAQDIVKLYHQAQIAAELGEFNDAINKFEEVLKLNPQFAKGYLELGNVYIKKGQDTNSVENAMRCFKEYLRLSPNAEDADKVKTSLDKLEYILERNQKKENALEFLQGRWATPAIENNYRRSSFIFDIRELDRKIIFDIEPSSFWYSTFFTDKKAYIDDANAAEYIVKFTDERTVLPSTSGKYLMGDLIGIATGQIDGILGSLANSAGQYLNSAAYEKDVPKKFQTVYELKINPVPDDKQELACTIHINYREISSVKNQAIWDTLFVTALHKVHDEYKNIMPLRFSSFSGLAYEVESKVRADDKLRYAPDKEISKLFISGTRLQNTGGGITGAGLGCILAALISPLFPENDPDFTREFNSYCYKIGGALCVVGIPLIVIGNQNVKAAVVRYNEAWDAATSTPAKPPKSSKTSEIRIGLTREGVGLAFTF